MEYGYLRESDKLAKKAGFDSVTGLCRTGLEEYLKVIFPEINDWEHDKGFPVLVNNKKCRKRPDYRSDTLKLVIEFDGLPHYQKPDTIMQDRENEIFYNNCGYKVVRIPYFIQLTNENVFKLFGKKVDTNLFPEGYTSLDPSQRNTPAFLCPAGILRMAKTYKEFPKEYQLEKEYLKQFDDQLTGLNLLEEIMKELD